MGTFFYYGYHYGYFIVVHKSIFFNEVRSCKGSRNYEKMISFVKILHLHNNKYKISTLIQVIRKTIQVIF